MGCTCTLYIATTLLIIKKKKTKLNQISFIELGDDWKRFQSLCSDYFREVKKRDENNLIDVKVDEGGTGPDGGKDIILTFRLNDSIVSFERRWVVQCKFYENLKQSNLDKINIERLIKRHKAIGYLLICKNTYTEGVKDEFDDLSNNCSSGFEYKLWGGNYFARKLYTEPSLHQHYFPQYFEYTEQSKVIVNQLLMKQ